jgi:hypothetical protein
VVIWEQDNNHVPPSGGHIVIDVLRDAVSAEQGDELVNQACSSYCSFKFMHPTMPLKQLTDDERDELNENQLTPIDEAAPRNFDLSTYADDGSDIDVLHSLA